MKEKRNWSIEVFRFMATISIAIYHFEWIYLKKPINFIHFYIFVEFFFVLSGFFLAYNAIKDKKSKRDTLDYILIEIKKLFPIYLMGFIFSFVTFHVVNNISINN